MANLTSQLLVRLIDGVSGPAKAASAALRRMNQAANGGGGFAAMQQRLGTAIARNNKAIDVLQGRMLGAAAAGYGLYRALSPTIGAAMEFSTVMEDLGQKAGLSGKKLDDVGKRIRQIGKQTNQGPIAAAKGVDFLVGMGLGGKTDQENVDNALAMAPAIGKAATAFRADFEDMARASHAVFFNLKTPAKEVIKAFDAMATAGQQGGFELKDMAKEFPALTASAQFLGMRGVPAVADLAAALQVARTGAADGATAANNMMNFLQKLNTKETVQNFKKMGVDVFKELDYARKKGLSPIEHMMEVLRKTTGGNANLITKIFGDKQVLEFIKPMWAQMDRYRQIRADALKAQGYTEEMFARRMETARAKLDKFVISLDNLKITLGNALLPGLTMVTDALTRMMGVFETFAEAHPKLAAAVVGIAAGLIALNIAGLAVAMAGRYAFGGLLMLSQGALFLLRPLAMIGGGIGSKVLGFFQTLALRARLAGNPGIFARIADGFMLIGRSILRVALSPLTMLRGAFGFLVGLGPIGWAVAAAIVAIAAGALFLWKNWEKVAAIGSGFWEGLTEGLAPVAEALQPVFDLVSSLGSKLWDLIPTLGGSTDSWREWGKALGTDVAAGINTVIGAVKTAVDWITWGIGKAREFGGAIRSWWSGGPSQAGEPAPGAGGGVNTPQLPPGRSRGGRVSRGSTYLVGERRAELFTPDQSGYINPRVPQGGGSGGVGPISITLNVDGAGDPRAVAEEAMRLLESKVRDLFRGVQGDTGLGFSY